MFRPLESFSRSSTSIEKYTDGWKKTQKEFEQNKVDKQRVKWLSKAPEKTISKAHTFGELARKSNDKKELQALQQLRVLRQNLNNALFQIEQRLKQEPQNQQWEKIRSNVFKALNEIDNELVLMGLDRHQKEFGHLDQTAIITYAKALSHFKGGAEAASTAVSYEEKKLIPKSVERPYMTTIEDTTEEALPFLRELAIGMKHDTREVPLESGSSRVFVPRVFAQDVMRGKYSLNGAILCQPGDPPERAIEAFHAYCRAMGGTNEGYVLASLLTQNHLVPQNQKARNIFKEQELYPVGRALFYEATVTQNLVKVTVKIAMEGKTVEEELKQALLLKREVIIPLREFREGASIIEGQRAHVQELDSKAESKQEAQTYRQSVASSQILFPEAKAFDSASSPIATGELAAFLLPKF